MLNSITCDTDPSEIISELNISAYLESLEEVVSNYDTKIKNTIIEEQTSSGLSTKAYAIDNHSTLQDKSNQLLDNNKISSNCESLKANITQSLTEQRVKEINKLIEKIEEKIKELEQQYQEISETIMKMIKDVTQPDTSEYVKQQANIETEIELYKQKLETVKGME